MAVDCSTSPTVLLTNEVQIFKAEIYSKAKSLTGDPRQIVKDNDSQLTESAEAAQPR